MKKELLLTAMITAGITTTAFAASNLDISATTAAPLSMKILLLMVEITKLRMVCSPL